VIKVENYGVEEIESEKENFFKNDCHSCIAGVHNNFWLACPAGCSSTASGVS